MYDESLPSANPLRSRVRAAAKRAAENFLRFMERE